MSKKEKKVLVVIQARMGSSRLPGKVLEKINGKSLIEILILRLSSAKRVTQIIVATTDNPGDDVLEAKLKDLGISCFRGSEKNVLDRFFQAVETFGADTIIRITGDCPLVDPGSIDEAITIFNEENLDYLSNSNPPTFPDGLDFEIFTKEQLELANRLAISTFEKEHVTPYIRENAIRVSCIRNSQDLSELRWTVDEYLDLVFIRELFKGLNYDFTASWTTILDYLNSNASLSEINSRIKRNEGAQMGEGQKLWRRAKHIIPGGNMLLSKRAELFLPDKWPSYFHSAKGCTITDLDGSTYIDMSIMGVGTNILGYGNDQVDRAVINTISKGNLSTLNAPEEVYLAEELLRLNPWAEMVRFARTGGEANAIAIRIARAASGRDNVAICGYHGWHDWYLSANLSDQTGLDGHLLPGLEPKGVPQNLKGTVFPFSYNDLDSLKKIIEEKDIGVIMMEVSRSYGPEQGFLEQVRDLASRNSIVLIFDECTSGFRETFGGLYQKYNVIPDMVMFGKALGNGYAITAIVGKREIMESAQSTFISSTFWTERIGSTAALATLRVMQETEAWVKITSLGNYIRKGWTEVANTSGLRLQHWGIPALAGFTVLSQDAQKYKTFITQEMLDQGYLAGNSFYASTAHDEKIIDKYLFSLEKIFNKIKLCEDGLLDINKLLHSPVAHESFRRLN
jgi:glutamate-1-semialdehyde 2,1-aminomutase